MSTATIENADTPHPKPKKKAAGKVTEAVAVTPSPGSSVGQRSHVTDEDEADEDEADEPNLNVGRNNKEAHRKKRRTHHSFSMNVRL
jgi:hypothetical protein